MNGPLAGLALLALLLHAGTAHADPDAARRVEAARRVQAAEARQDAAEARARAAARAAAAAESDAAGRLAALAPLLPLLRRIALFPAESLLAAPVPAEEALVGLIVLGGLSRDLARDAAAAAETAALARDHAAATALAARQLAEARATARAEAALLDAELTDAARRRAIAPPDPETQASRRVAETAGTARDLDGALGRLRRAPAQPASVPLPAPVPSAAGRAPPVFGRVLRPFGAAGEAGPAQGITWAAAPLARVVSPCAGRTVFAGPFRGYGLLLIVDCGDGYHFVLAGLDRLDATTGQRLLTGEPVGRLGGTETARPTLYGELRRLGQAVDPKDWLGRNVAG